MKDEKLIVGFDTSDDACVYRLRDDLAAIHTVDFFPPMVDEPYLFGAIAAANALSDVYAMGGTPAVAMNLLCVPNCLSKETIREILRGGHDKAVEAGCVIAGGHTIEDDVPKYGLCVTGYVHPDKILRNTGARVGDVLVLTKPIGSGVITTAAKADMAEEEDYKAMLGYLATLNKAAGEAAVAAGNVSACTDVTGFGLLGHAYEMAAGSEASLLLDTKKIPYMHGAPALAQMGLLPGGAYRNMDYVKGRFRAEDTAERWCIDLMADPQTSGGLLVALPRENAEKMLEMLRAAAPDAAVIGEVIEKQDAEIIVK